MHFIAGVVAAVVFFLPMPHKAVAQDVTYKWDAGGATGLSGYLGDYSQVTRLSVLDSGYLFLDPIFWIHVGVSGQWQVFPVSRERVME